MTKTKKKIIAGALTLTMVSALVFVGVSPLLKDKKTADVPHYDQIVITPDESYGVELMSTTIDPVEYETYGISEQAESAQSVTAVMTPEGSFTVFDWSVAWSDSTDEFASGKTVTDYISVAATSDGANTATVTCYGEFGTQIVLTAQSRTNSALKATATIDYDVRIKGVGFTLSFDDTAKSAVGVTNIVKIDSYESANITMPAPNKITEAGTGIFVIQANTSEYTTTNGITASKGFCLSVKCSDSFAEQLTAQGVSATTEFNLPNDDFSNQPTEDWFYNTVSSVTNFTSSYLNGGFYVAKLYGALCRDIVADDEVSFNEKLVQFVNAAKATDGYHFELKVRVYPYGDTTKYVETSYYVTFSAETLVSVEPTSVGFEDTSLWF